MDELGVSSRPLLIMGRGWAVYAGPLEAGRPHRHQATQLAWCGSGTLLLEGAWGALEAPGHAIQAGVSHRLVASQPVRMVFEDPTLQAAAYSTSPAPAVAAMTEEQAAHLEQQLIRWLQGPQLPTAHSPSHPAVPRWQSVLHWLEAALDGPLRASDAAQAVGLSPSRFMHWFAEMSGLSFRAYVRWLRLQRAVRVIADGSTLTDAAHLAGFADSAHLTRTFVATFGVRPAPLRAARIVCDDRSKPPLTVQGLSLTGVAQGLA